MLEKAIEIEGLLRIIRDGEPLPETYILLNNKTAELAEQAVRLEEKATPSEPATPQADFVMAPPTAPAPGLPEVTFTVHEPRTKEDELVATTETAADLTEEDSTAIADDLSLIEEDDILLSFDEPGDFSISSTTPEPSEEKDAPSPSEATAETPTPEGAPEETRGEAPGDVAGEASEVAPEKVMEMPEHQAKDEAASKPTQQPKRQIKLKSAFSLNDRFLYARELFEGNMKMFDSTLEFIEGIEDYSIIEDYFYSELEWDPENPHVAAFMDILTPHFKE